MMNGRGESDSRTGPRKSPNHAFGGNAANDERSRGRPKPGTFDSLGLTHSCGKMRRG
jgi:hypothetical protein